MPQSRSSKYNQPEGPPASPGGHCGRHGGHGAHGDHGHHRGHDRHDHGHGGRGHHGDCPFPRVAPRCSTPSPCRPAGWEVEFSRCRATIWYEGKQVGEVINLKGLEFKCFIGWM